MRLDPAAAAAIAQVVTAHDRGARAYLYGSRVNDALRGGDIDLLVISAACGLSQRLDLLVSLKQHLGEQRIDLLLRSPEGAQDDPFVRSILATAVRLA